MLARPALTEVYTIAGRRISIDTIDAWSAQAVSDIFSGWFLKPVPTRDDQNAGITLRVRPGVAPPHIPHELPHFQINEGGTCHTDGQKLHLRFNDSLVNIGPDATQPIEIWIARRYEPGSKILTQIVSQAFSAALRRLDLYEFHSAAVLPPHHDKAILIAGASGSGKTTLTTQLVAHGWNYLTDDTLLLDSTVDGLEVHVLRKFFALTSETIAALQLSSLKTVRFGTKARVTPQALFPAKQIDRAKPGAIFFPTLTRKAVTELRKLTASESMTRLLRLCPWASYDKPTAGKHLGVLHRLAETCVAFDFLAGTDVLENRSLTADLCLSYIGT